MGKSRLFIFIMVFLIQLPMTGFKPCTSGVRSDHSRNQLSHNQYPTFGDLPWHRSGFRIGQLGCGRSLSSWIEVSFIRLTGVQLEDVDVLVDVVPAAAAASLDRLTVDVGRFSLVSSFPFRERAHPALRHLACVDVQPFDAHSTAPVL